MDGHGKTNGAAPPLPVVEVSKFIGEEPQPRVFIDSAGLIPMRNVTLLSGDGGTGKSLLALQLALAVSTVLPDWIGIAIGEGSNGGVVYLSAEDDMLEIHKRLSEICAAEGADLSAAIGLLSFLDMAGEDATLAAEKAHSGVMARTPLYDRLEGLLGQRSPILLILDNQADVYAGNENSRSPVKQFVGLLRHLAMKHDCAILLLGHPSLSGRSSGSGESGSTAWNNSVRSRLYLKRVDASEGDEDMRVLEAMKSNYGRKGRAFGMKWHDGRFVRKDAVKARDKVTTAMQDEVASEAAKGFWRCDPKHEQWFGNWLAARLDVDVGEGLNASERSTTQLQHRYEIINLLKGYVDGKVIRKVMKKDSHRDMRPYYEAGRGFKPTAQEE